jgi:hypothetical protein
LILKLLAARLIDNAMRRQHSIRDATTQSHQKKENNTLMTINGFDNNRHNNHQRKRQRAGENKNNVEGEIENTHDELHAQWILV